MSEARALGTTVDRAYTPTVTRVKTVRVIPPTIQPLTDIPAFSARPRRVAAYARVSTSSEEQLTSYEAQVKHYTEYIKSKENSDNWQFVDVYTDKGITGVSTKKREGFNRMIQDALAGRIDLIITKSVSRFARNTVDTLTAIRKLKEYGVEVYFEEQNIYTLDGKVGPAVTLNEELRSTQEYMRIMRLRYGDRFELNVSAPEELRACYVPKLILQPIIENSVFHGMSTIEDGGLIFIETTLDKDVLMVNVTDNGCGMNTEKTAVLLDNHQSGEIKSTGLINTDARIRLYFGEGYGLTVNSALGVGTHVSVRLKLIKTMEEWEEIVHENRA